MDIAFRASICAWYRAVATGPAFHLRRIEGLNLADRQAK